MLRIFLFILFFLLLTIPVLLVSRRVRHLHRKWLIALRLTAVFILLLIFFNPLKGWVTRAKIPEPSLPILDIFLDCSPSMEINNSIKWAQGWLLTNLPKLQQENFIRLYAFSSTTNRIFQLKEISFKTQGNRTNLTFPLQKALKSTPRPARILLISDGMDTISVNGQRSTVNEKLIALTKILERKEIPLLVLDVNDASLCDLQIEDVIVKGGPEKLVGQPVELKVHLNCTGNLHNQIKFSVQRQHKIVKTVSKKIVPRHQKQIVNFSFIPKKVGNYVYKIVAKTQDTETTPQNNIAPFFLRVIPKRKIKVGLFADVLDWDYTFIKRTLEKDESIQLESAIQTSQTNIYRQGIPAGSEPPKWRGHIGEKAELLKYDVIILIEPGSESFDKDRYTNIVAFVKRRGGGLLIIGGERLFSEHNFWSEQLEKILPVKFPVDSAEALIEESFMPRITAAGKSSLLFSSWQNSRLPELFDFIKPAEVKPSAKILITNPAQDSPVLTVSRVGAGKIALLLSHSTWRWSFAPAKEKKLYSKFWKDFVFWLAEESLKSRNIKLLTDKTKYHPGEKAEITAYIFDKTYSLIENIQPVLEIIPPTFFLPLKGGGVNKGVPASGAKQKVCLEKENGVWKGIYSPTEEGKYTLNLDTFQEDNLIGSDRTGFLVTRANEFGFYPTGTHLLKRMARRNYYTKSRGKELVEKLTHPGKRVRFFSKEGIKKASSPVWKRFLNTTVLFILFLGLIFSEWWLRRQQGLP